MFTDPSFETNPTTDIGKPLTGLQLVKTMSERAAGPFGASALLKEFAKTCPGSQLHGSTVVFLEKLHLCIPPKCCNPHENCAEVPRVLLPHTSRMLYSSLFYMLAYHHWIFQSGQGVKPTNLAQPADMILPKRLQVFLGMSIIAVISI